MQLTNLGSTIYSEDDIIEALKVNPNTSLESVLCDTAEDHNSRIENYYLDFDKLLPANTFDDLTETQHEQYQRNWKMPEKYADFQIVEWLLMQCNDEDELQRMGEELLLYQDMDLFDLLKYCKYLVDTCGENNIVMGVGRGSSVASFALYKIGIHKINSLFYDLDIREFLK